MSLLSTVPFCDSQNLMPSFSSGLNLDLVWQLSSMQTRKSACALPTCPLNHTASGELESIFTTLWCLCKSQAEQQTSPVNSVAWFVQICTACLNTWTPTFTKRKNVSSNVMNVGVAIGMLEAWLTTKRLTKLVHFSVIYAAKKIQMHCH